MVFLGQILLISYYFPKKITQRVNTLLEKFPPSDYPKLYPQPVARVTKGQSIFKVLNLIILIIGLALLFIYGLLSGGYDDNQKHAEGLPLFYGMLQFLPFILMEISGFKQFKLMKKNDLRKSRSAELQPRRLFEFISPLSLIIAIVVYVSYIFFELYIHQFTWNFEVVTKLISITLCNILFIGLTLRNLYGKKLDPFQANKDRLRQIRFATQSMIKISIIASLFLMITTLVDVLNVEHIEIIFNSLYFQVIAFFGVGATLQAMNWDEIDFDVYRIESLTNEQHKV